MIEENPVRRAYHHVRGAKPTRAGSAPRAEITGSSAAGDWPWGRTRIALRGAITKWSARDELLRFRMVAWQRGAPVRIVRVAWGGGFLRLAGEMQADRLVGRCTCLPEPGGKKATCDDHGNPHVVQAGIFW